MAKDSPIKVAIFGGSGPTGRSIINGLLAADTKFDIISYTRDESLESEQNDDYRDSGIKVAPADLRGPLEKLVEQLQGIDVVISTVFHTCLRGQIPLAKAAKAAGVKRFIPCNFGTPGIRGVVRANDAKLDVLDNILALHLPFTIIDVGWWSELALSSALVPSRRLDHLLAPHCRVIPGDGNVRNAFTSQFDVGKFVARIIVDPRTINRKVFAYTDVMTYNELATLVEDISGEKTLRQYVSAGDILKAIKDGEQILENDPDDTQGQYMTIVNQYYNSYGIRGDNTPEIADYLGYVSAKDLYPDFKGDSMSDIIKRALEGPGKA